MTLKTISEQYTKPDFQQWVNEYFTEKVNETPELKDLRDWVEENIFGFGERSFYWLWKLIVDEMPSKFKFLEIGVFRGQTLALVALLAELAGKEVEIYGVTPLDSTGGHWESNYYKDISTIHQEFDLPDPIIIKGLSTDKEIFQIVKDYAPFDIVYIDGGHDFEVVESDMKNYPQFAEKYLVVDDCCNDIPMPNGYFTGIDSVTKAVNEWERRQTNFDLLFNVVHNKLYKNRKNLF